MSDNINKPQGVSEEDLSDALEDLLLPLFSALPADPRRYYGVPKAGAKNVRELGAILDKTAKKKGHAIPRDDFSDEAVNTLATRLAKEVADEVKLGTSAIGWYGPRFQKALQILSKRFPELASDEAAKGLFTAILAITSNGQSPQTNMASAIESYEEYKRSGNIGEITGGGKANPSINAGLRQLDRFFKQSGSTAQGVEALLTENKVSDLNKFAKQAGINFSSGYKASETLPLAAVVLGPKVGVFFSNLMGREGHLTMDRWWMRTVNRHRGTNVPEFSKGSSEEGQETGFYRFQKLLGNPDLSDDEVIMATIPYRASADKKGYKNLTPLESAGNILWKAVFQETNEAPKNAGERSFMLRATKKAQEKLARRGIKLSIADIQAILWYYEKKLYAALSAKAPKKNGMVAFEDVAPSFVGDTAPNPDLDPEPEDDADDEPEERYDEASGRAV